MARGLRLGAAVGSDGVPIPIVATGPNEAALIELAALIDADPTSDGTLPSRPWLVGGALTSAALSIAGAAYVAWRLSRPSAAPMARAVRAVSRTRLA